MLKNVKVKLFLHSLLFNTIYGSNSYYRYQKLDKPFREFTATEIIFFIVVAGLLVGYFVYIMNMYTKAKHIPKKTRVLIFLLSLITAMALIFLFRI